MVLNEKKVVLEQGSTTINGPHQGAIVDTPDDQWAFFHFQHHHCLRRVVHLQPMHLGKRLARYRSRL